MCKEKILSLPNLENFNFEETKKNVIDYFMYLEKLHWELAKLNVQKGLTANYDFSAEYTEQPYIPIRKDVFKMSIKGHKEEQLKEHLSTYYWAKSVLSYTEQLYISECFENHTYEAELVDMLGFSSVDSKAFKKLKKSAVYKFADFLDLVVEKE